MRRHLAGIGLAIVMVLAMFFAGSWGYVRLLRLPAASNAPVSALPAQGGSLLSTHGVLAAVGAVAVTGLLAGILIAFPRISPLASGLAGLFAIAWEAVYLVSVHKAVKVIPLKAHAFGSGWEALLFNGILGAVGLMMIIPLFVPSRWRGRYDDDEDEEEEAGYVAGLKSTMRPTDMPTDQVPVGAMAGAPRGPHPGLMRRPPRALPPAGSAGPGRPGGPDFGDAPTTVNPVPGGLGGPAPGGPGPGGPGGRGRPGGPRGPRTGLIGGPPSEGDPRMRPRPSRRPYDGF